MNTQTKPGILDEFLTTEELADEFDKTPRTIQRWRKLRIGPPATLVGSQPLYFIPDIRAWLASKKQSRTARN